MINFVIVSSTLFTIMVALKYMFCSDFLFVLQRTHVNSCALYFSNGYTLSQAFYMFHICVFSLISGLSGILKHKLIYPIKIFHKEKSTEIESNDKLVSRMDLTLTELLV